MLDLKELKKLKEGTVFEFNGSRLSFDELEKLKEGTKFCDKNNGRYIDKRGFAVNYEIGELSSDWFDIRGI